LHHGPLVPGRQLADLDQMMDQFLDDRLLGELVDSQEDGRWGENVREPYGMGYTPACLHKSLQ
jgi:hypothetical protein